MLLPPLPFANLSAFWRARTKWLCETIEFREQSNHLLQSISPIVTCNKLNYTSLTLFLFEIHFNTLFHDIKYDYTTSMSQRGNPFLGLCRELSIWMVASYCEFL